MALSLARKYRPKKFADVAVQSHVSTTLQGAIARGRVAHGYLFCGPRGTGKTTLARVLAMALNCENEAVRKAGEDKFSKDTKKFGVEVFHDDNDGLFVIISEAGSIGVRSGK